MKKVLLLFFGMFASVNCMEPDNDHLEFTNLSQQRIMEICSYPPTEESIKRYDYDRNLLIRVFRYKFKNYTEEKQALVDEVVNSVKERDIKKRHDLLAISLKKVYEYAGKHEKDGDLTSLWGMTSCSLDTGNRFGLFVNEHDPRIALFVKNLDRMHCFCEPHNRYVEEKTSTFDQCCTFF